MKTPKISCGRKKINSLISPEDVESFIVLFFRGIQTFPSFLQKKNFSYIFSYFFVNSDILIKVLVEGEQQVSYNVEVYNVVHHGTIFRQKYSDNANRDGVHNLFPHFHNKTFQALQPFSCCDDDQIVDFLFLLLLFLFESSDCEPSTN